VASVHNYKRIENSLFRKTKNLVVSIGKSVFSFFKKLVTLGNRRYTIMLSPIQKNRCSTFR